MQVHLLNSIGFSYPVQAIHTNDMYFIYRNVEIYRRNLILGHINAALKATVRRRLKPDNNSDCRNISKEE